MRHLLTTATVAALLVSSGSAVQEARPDPGASPTPEQLVAAEEQLATATCLGQSATMVAVAGVETLGTAGADVIVGTEGDDIIRGGGGNDRICGYGGADTLDGGGGNDTIDGGPGADKITGAAGKDRLTGAAGDDTLNGGKGADVCVGGKGIDWLPSCNEKRATRGTVTVTRNTKLKGPHKGRFIIGRDRVTLDCDGHTITGAGRKVEDIHAITLLRRKGVTVRNCDIRDHGRGFQVERSNRNTLTHNRMSRVGNGIVLSRSDRNRLLANSVTDTDGSAYVLMFGSDRNRLRDNVVTEAGHQGFSIWFSDRNEISDNIVTDSTIGFLVGESDAEGRVAERNVFSRNSAIDNADWGFEDRTTGFKGDAGTDNHYRDNTCTGDAGGGKSSPATLCEPATVPAMVGLGAEAAGRALRQAGLAGAPREVFSETVPAGVVVSQALAPGTAVDKGRSIVYTVSVGPDVGAEGNDPEA